MRQVVGIPISLSRARPIAYIERKDGERGTKPPKLTLDAYPVPHAQKHDKLHARGSHPVADELFRRVMLLAEQRCVRDGRDIGGVPVLAPAQHRHHADSALERHFLLPPCVLVQIQKRNIDVKNALHTVQACRKEHNGDEEVLQLRFHSR